MKYLIIIPARGGSKGIPKKNIVPINGAPLIQYTISAALGVQETLSDVSAIVSTDDAEIRAVGVGCGIDVPFLRPSKLSGDESSSTEYVRHAIEFFHNQSIEIDNIIILQPTSPLRDVQDVLNAIVLFENEPSASLISGL